MPRPSARRNRRRRRRRCCSPPTSSPGWGRRRSRSARRCASAASARSSCSCSSRSLEELESATLSVLAPDLRHAFGVSNGDDRVPRARRRARSWCSARCRWAGWPTDTAVARSSAGPTSRSPASSRSCGAVTNAFQLFWARLGVGVAKSNTYPVQGSLIADTYPIGARGRINACAGDGRRASSACSARSSSPASRRVAGGDDGWRWPFVLLGIPVAIVALFAFKLPEPPRGQFEKQDVLGEVIEDAKPAPISVEAAFARLWQIRTLKTVHRRVRGDGLRAVHRRRCSANLFMEDQYGTEHVRPGCARHHRRPRRAARAAVRRRSTTTASTVAIPPEALRLVGLIDPARRAPHAGAVLHAQRHRCSRSWASRSSSCCRSAFTMVAAGPAVGRALPAAGHGLGARRRSTSSSSARPAARCSPRLLTDEFGPRAAVIADRRPVDDHRRVPDPAQRELHPQRPLAGRRRAPRGDGRAPAPAGIARRRSRRSRSPTSTSPTARCRCCSTSASRCGRARCSRCSAPTAPASRRSCAPSPASARRRAASSGSTAAPSRTRRPSSGRGSASASCSAARACSRAMTVHENLEMAAFVYRGDDADFERRIDRVLRAVPRAGRATDADRGVAAVGWPAADARARRWRCSTTPRCSLIDELSLGLAPLVVQELLGVIERLKAEGMTIILVEQSLNVALSVADRAVFLEKGAGALRGSRRGARRARRPRPGRVPRDAKAADRGGGRHAGSRRSSSSTGSSPGLVIGLLAMGIVLDLPVDAGHQLRGRQHGARRRRPARAPRRSSTASRSGSRAIASLVVGTLFGAVMELVVIRRLFYAPRVIVLVATIGIAELSRSRSSPRTRRSPTSARRIPPAVDDTWSDVARRPDHRRAARGARRRADRRGRARLVPQPHAGRHARSRRRPRTPTSRACRASTRSSCRPSVWVDRRVRWPRSR